MSPSLHPSKPPPQGCPEAPDTLPGDHFLSSLRLSPPSTPASLSEARSLKLFLPPAGTSLTKTLLQPFIGARAPSLLRMWGACYTASQLHGEGWEALESRLPGAPHPEAWFLSLEWGHLGFPAFNTRPTAATSAVRFMWCHWGFFFKKKKKQGVC